VAELRDVFHKNDFNIDHYHYWRAKEEGYLAVKKIFNNALNEFIIYIHWEVYERNTKLDAFSEKEIQEKKEKYQVPSSVIETWLKKNDYTILKKGLVEAEISGKSEIGAYILFGKEGKDYMINILDEIPT
jgi:hypothetical protein